MQTKIIITEEKFLRLWQFFLGSCENRRQGNVIFSFTSQECIPVCVCAWMSSASIFTNFTAEIIPLRYWRRRWVDKKKKNLSLNAACKDWSKYQTRSTWKYHAHPMRTGANISHDEVELGSRDRGGTGGGGNLIKRRIGKKHPLMNSTCTALLILLR